MRRSGLDGSPGSSGRPPARSRRNLQWLGALYGTNKSYARLGFLPIYQSHLSGGGGVPWSSSRSGSAGTRAGCGPADRRFGCGAATSPTPRSSASTSGHAIFREPRIRTFAGDQADAVFLDGVLAEIGTPDVIIDDGSHRSEHITASFEHLWPRLADGGLYVIEDTHTSYLAEFGGGPPGTDGTTMEMVKTLVDRPIGGDVASLHVHPDLVLVWKAPRPDPHAVSSNFPSTSR